MKMEVIESAIFPGTFEVKYAFMHRVIRSLMLLEEGKGIRVEIQAGDSGRIMQKRAHLYAEQYNFRIKTRNDGAYVYVCKKEPKMSRTFEVVNA